MTRSRKSSRLNGAQLSAMEAVRNRLVIAILTFAGAFVFLGVRTIDLGLGGAPGTHPDHFATVAPTLPQRADITDRHGQLLATNLEIASLYADPAEILDADEAARLLSRVLPDLNEVALREKLTSKKRFVWLKRRLTPEQTWRVNALGLPGLAFKTEEERVYPRGRLAVHALGHVGVDGDGLAGIELYYDTSLRDPARNGAPLRTSLDIRVQHALTDELRGAMLRFDAIAAAGLVMDVRTGELLALASLPDYDPNRAGDFPEEAHFNRVTTGVYELGSIFKTFTVAMALEAGTITLASGYDATDPIRIARFLIRDDHPKKRYLTVPEIFAFSSNIGAAKMAADVGGDAQQAFLSSVGLLDEAQLELPEIGRPIYPARWREINTMTIAYGHGIAVNPLQLARGIAAMVNGGVLIPATLEAKSEDATVTGRKVISPTTSQQIRALMRAAVLNGTGSQADAPGYRVGGKTGTAEKSVGGRYEGTKLLSSFVGVFPGEAPEYLVFAMLDEPVGTAETFNFRGGGWVAAPVVRNVVLRIAPMLGVEPREEEDRRFQRVALMVDADE